MRVARGSSLKHNSAARALLLGMPKPVSFARFGPSPRSSTTLKPSIFIERERSLKIRHIYVNVKNGFDHNPTSSRVFISVSGSTSHSSRLVMIELLDWGHFARRTVNIGNLPGRGSEVIPEESGREKCRILGFSLLSISPSSPFHRHGCTARPRLDVSRRQSIRSFLQSVL